MFYGTMIGLSASFNFPLMILIGLLINLRPQKAPGLSIVVIHPL